MIIVYLGVIYRVPQLDQCEIYDQDLVDPQLKHTYRKIPRLPRYSIDCIVLYFSYTFSVRMADFAPAYGRCDTGGFKFSEVLQHYQSPDVE